MSTGVWLRVSVRLFVSPERRGELPREWASNKMFLRNDGSYSISNDLLATQFLYSFQDVFALPESIDDEREIDEGDEHYIQFVELREDAP